MKKNPIKNVNFLIFSLCSKVTSSVSGEAMYLRLNLTAMFPRHCNQRLQHPWRLQTVPLSYCLKARSFCVIVVESEFFRIGFPFWLSIFYIYFFSLPLFFFNWFIATITLVTNIFSIAFLFLTFFSVYKGTYGNTVIYVCMCVL